jgi:hypothetical protein
MTTVLTFTLAGLTLTCLGLSLALYRHIQLAKVSHEHQQDLASLPPTLQRMLNTVRRSNDWGQLEFMRQELRRALYQVDRMRHDTSNAALRVSKQSAEDEVRATAFDDGAKMAQAALATQPGPLLMMDEFEESESRAAYAKGWNSICAGEENRRRPTEQAHT